MTDGGTRVLQIELNYGRHREAVFDVPAVSRPVVIAGPNGAGKTTLLEALARGLCGFNRRVDAESSLLDARREGLDSCWCRVRLRDDEGRLLELHRTFDDSTVKLTDVESGDVLFRGDANPGGDNEETRAFRRRLEDLLGFTELDPYRRTAFVVQGELIRTRLDRDLLRVATGGGEGVEEALRKVAGTHRELTVRPISEGGGRARKDRKLEELEARLADLQERLRETEDLERRRERVLSQLDEVDKAREEEEARRDRLRDGLEPLHAEASLVGRVKHLKALHEQTDRLLARLREAASAARNAKEAPGEDAGRYPDDFREKVATARELWSRREKLEERNREMRRKLDERRAAAAQARTFGNAAGVAALVLAGVAALTGVVWAWALAAAAGVAAVWFRLGRGAKPEPPEAMAADEEELADVEERLQAISAAVPGGDRLTPDNVELHLVRFEEQREVERKAEEARQELGRVVHEARELVREEGSEQDQGGEAPVLHEPDALARRLEQLSRTAVQKHARAEVELEEKRRKVNLPEGVPRDPKDVDRALREAEDRVNEFAARVQSLKERLYREDSPTRSSTALRDQIERTNDEVQSVEEHVQALEEAHRMLRVAYERFREGDEDRLLRGISERLESLTGGELGPVETDGELGDATISLYGRRVRLDSPALSYGERTATRLAIRLAATDFLGRSGVRPPLVVDEPFDDLDPERARGVWELLSRVAEERQVIVASQDRLVLDWLGVEPDVELQRLPSPEPPSLEAAGGDAVE